VVIGFDTRFGSREFAEVATSTMADLGVPVYLCRRPMPTPTISYSIIDKRAAGGVIITASHNPGQYNGFKFRPDYAGSARPEIIGAIEARIPDETGALKLPLAEARQRKLVEDLDPWLAYRAKLESLVNFERVKAAGFKVAVDAMHGALHPLPSCVVKRIPISPGCIIPSHLPTTWFRSPKRSKPEPT
jgi:phosphomannomutase